MATIRYLTAVRPLLTARRQVQDRGVYDIAPHVAQWLADGRDPTVAVVIGTRGFSSSSPAAAAAWTAEGSTVGRLVAGLETAPGTGFVDVTISDDDAVRAGLACGGLVSLFVQPASEYPADIWMRLIDRQPVCMVAGTDTAELYTPTTVRDAAAYGDAVPRLFGRGVTGAQQLDDDRFAVVYWPVPSLVVVGDGLIAAALRDAAALLGWSTSITSDVTDAVAAIDALHRCDAMVVLSHDRNVDGPALAAALNGTVGYVGGLGSRRTQAARREWLTEHGVPADAQDRIHGPAGLDIDAHSPAEIAVSIVAEILAARAGSTGGALRDRVGPVHVGGVQAPPPRY